MAVLQVLILLKWVNFYTEKSAIEEKASEMNICISHRECIKLQKGSLRNKMSVFNSILRVIFCFKDFDQS